MDIDKICRCCLALNGPLLSIYDGGSAESGCVADMLRGIAKLNPQQNDNMPEKVCLSCVSEINRCFVFKMKCENSNKTLRQLLPGAVKEHFEDNSVEVNRSDATAQTSKTEIKKIISRGVQTTLPEKLILLHREIQTDVADESVAALQILLESETGSESYFKEDEQAAAAAALKTESCAIVSSPTDKLEKKNEKKIRLHEAPQQLSAEDAQQSTYILIEDTDIVPQKLIIHELIKDEHDGKSNKSSPCPEYYDELEENNEKNDSRETTILPESDFTSEEANVHDNEILSDSDCNQESKQESVAPNKRKTKNRETEDNKTNNSLKRMYSIRRELYKCSFCIMTFVSLKVLRRHLSKRHDIVDTEIIVDEFSPPMEVSDEASQSPDSAVEQQISLTMENVPNPRLLPRERVAPKHDKQVHSKFKHFCEYCMAGFVQRKTLRYHMKLKNCMSDNFKCNQCDRIFISEENLEKHIETHNSQFSCLECNKECGTIEQLSRHMIEEHNRNARNQCDTCKKVFTMRASLIDHMRIHSGEKPFVCSVCGKAFAQNSNLRQHLMRHTNEKNFKCDTCPKAYVTKAELFSHKRTHTGDHPFKCDICKASFTSSSSLLKHKRKHTGERPYECEFCPMRFAALNVLKNHQRTHTGEKPYKCTFCNKSFTQKGDCLLHQRTHEVGEVECFCGSKFSKMSNLRQHLKNKHPNMTDEKRKELDEAICRRKNNNKDVEYLITLAGDIDASAYSEENNELYYTVDTIEDDNNISPERNAGEVSDIIIEEDIEME